MSRQIKLLAFSGSLRKDSWNHQLVSLAATAARDAGAEIELIRLEDYPLPFLNQDTEETLQHLPELLALRKLFSSCDGLLIASPEYNGSLSSTLKNTLDWLSRPAFDNSYTPSYTDKTVGLLSASPGGLGGVRGLNHLRDILTSLGSLVVPQQLALSAAYEAFDETGQLNNEVMADSVRGIAQAVVQIIHNNV